MTTHGKTCLRILLILLIAVFTSFTAAGILFARADGTYVEVSALSGEIESGKYRLTQDIEISAPLVIGAGKEVTLDLNGHVITQTGLLSSVISVSGGELTIEDGNPDAPRSLSADYFTTEGKIEQTAVFKGGALYGGDGTPVDISNGTASVSGDGIAGGGIFISGGGSVTMNGGNIVGNTTKNDRYVGGSGNNSACVGAGVYIADGSFTLNGGEIAYNSCSYEAGRGKNGGGVYVFKGEFIMTGGAVHHNFSTTMGGGVYLNYSSGPNSFEMRGGKIYGNYSATGGGVYAGDTNGNSSVFRLYGGEIYGNTTAADSAAVVTREIDLNIAGNIAIYGNTVVGTEQESDVITNVININGKLDGAKIGIKGSETGGQTVINWSDETDGSPYSYFYTNDINKVIIPVGNNVTVSEISADCISDNAAVNVICDGGVKQYESFAEGLINTSDGGVIQLLKDVDSAEVNKSLTLDINGRALGALTVNSGNVTVADCRAVTPLDALTVNGGKATICGITVKSAEISGGELTLSDCSLAELKLADGCYLNVKGALKAENPIVLDVAEGFTGKIVAGVTFEDAPQGYFVTDREICLDGDGDAAVKAHGYDSECQWNGTSAEFVFTCTECGHVERIAAEVTSVSTPATCTEDGFTVYTAKANFGGETYSDSYTVTDTDSATGHSYVKVSVVWSGDECTFGFECDGCGDTHSETVTAVSSKTDATCTEDGYTVYTATVTFGGETYTETNKVVDEGSATGHDWNGDVCSRCGESRNSIDPEPEGKFPVAAIVVPVIAVAAVAVIVAIVLLKKRKN